MKYKCTEFKHDKKTKTIHYTITDPAGGNIRCTAFNQPVRTVRRKIKRRLQKLNEDSCTSDAVDRGRNRGLEIMQAMNLAK